MPYLYAVFSEHNKAWGMKQKPQLAELYFNLQNEWTLLNLNTQHKRSEAKVFSYHSFRSLMFQSKAAK